MVLQMMQATIKKLCTYVNYLIFVYMACGFQNGPFGFHFENFYGSEENFSCFEGEFAKVSSLFDKERLFSQQGRWKPKEIKGPLLSFSWKVFQNRQKVFPMKTASPLQKTSPENHIKK